MKLWKKYISKLKAMEPPSVQNVLGSSWATTGLNQVIIYCRLIVLLLKK